MHADTFCVDELVELQLRKSSDIDAPSARWKAVIQSVLRAIVETPHGSASPETTALRDRIVQCRDELAQSLHPQEERRLAANCVTSCEHYLRAVRQHQNAREHELIEMVTIVREAAARMLGESSELTDRLTSTAGRFRMLANLDDIRELKRQLTTEVMALERLVEEKRDNDRRAVENLSERVASLEQDLEKAQEEATIDIVTKVPNRAAFDRTLDRMVEGARKHATPLTLAMIDVDHFKSINDEHGHPVGDRVLLCTAEWLTASVRQTDFVARYGGEEFAVLLDGADLARAEKRLTQVLRDIAGRSYEYEADGDQRAVRFTVSCGVTQFVNHDTAKDLVGRADQALYDAKHRGRNCVVVRKASILSRLLARA